jgi:peptidoglycan/xylan/chitin deacetylase (PgdA/CDA1 family)
MRPRRTRSNDVVRATDVAKIGDLRFPLRRSRSTAQVKVNLPANRSSSGWLFSGSQPGLDTVNSSTDFTGDAMYGDRCLKLVTNGGGQQTNARIILGAPVDVSDCDMRLHVKFEDKNVNAFRVQCGNGGLTQVSTAVVFGYSGLTDAQMLSKPWQSGRWQTFDVPLSAFTGTFTNWAALERIQFVVSDTNVPTTAKLHGVEFVKRDPFGVNPNGTVVWSFDDSYASQYTVALPMLKAKGWRATLMPIIDQIDTTASFLTTTQVRNLFDVEGWEIGGHCFSASTHAIGLPALTSAQRCNEFEAMHAYNDGYGFRSPSHSYPLGNHDLATEVDVAKYFAHSRCASYNLNETICPPRRYALQALNVTAGAAAISAAAAKARDEKGLLFIMGHSFVESGGTSNDITPAALQAVVDAVAASGCDVRTQEEAMALARVA